MPANVITQQEKDRQAPKVRDLPIGTGATGKRKESDSLGEVEVPRSTTGALRPSGL